MKTVELREPDLTIESALIADGCLVICAQDGQKIIAPDIDADDATRQSILNMPGARVTYFLKVPGSHLRLEYLTTGGENLYLELLYP